MQVPMQDTPRRLLPGLLVFGSEAGGVTVALWLRLLCLVLARGGVLPIPLCSAVGLMQRTAWFFLFAGLVCSGVASLFIGK